MKGLNKRSMSSNRLSPNIQMSDVFSHMTKNGDMDNLLTGVGHKR